MQTKNRGGWQLRLRVSVWALMWAGVVWAPPVLSAAPEPGLEITAQNVDQYAQYLSESMVTKVRQGEIYKVFPTSPVEKLVYPKWLEMTRNPPQGKAVMLDEAGTWGLADGSPWPGGFPFPGSSNPREIMANFQYHIMADDLDTDPPGLVEGAFILIDGKGQEYKRLDLNLTQRRMTSRVWVAPIGSEPGYENELYRTNTIFFAPYDVRGLVVMNIIYRDQAKLPDGYVYVPVLRRVRRQASSQRADSIAGSDLTLGDVETFSDPLGMWDFKLLETKKMLTTLNHATDSSDVYQRKATLKNNYFPVPYSSVELRDTHVIEATPRYDTIYSKKILHVDADSYIPTVGEFFDRQGKLLKSYHLYWDIADDFTPNPRWIVIKNMQTNSATVLALTNLASNVGTPLSRVLTSSMKDFGR